MKKIIYIVLNFCLFCSVTYGGDESSSMPFKEFKSSRKNSIYNYYTNLALEPCRISVAIDTASSQQAGHWYPEINARIIIESDVFYEISGIDQYSQTPVQFSFYKRKTEIPLTIKAGGSGSIYAPLPPDVLFFRSKVFYQYIGLKLSDPKRRMDESNQYEFVLKAYFFKTPLLFNHKLIEMVPQKQEIIMLEFEART